MSPIMNKLVIDNNVTVDNLDTITKFFEDYQLGKPASINYNNYEKNAVLELEYWYNTNSAINMYNRINEMGEARIVYDDPHYFTVKFYNDSNSADYRDEYLLRENDVYDACNCDIHHGSEYCDNHNIEYENTIAMNTTNAMNIKELFNQVEQLTLNMKTTNRRLGNIQKKTNILYKHRPRVTKRSVWKSRLRPRPRARALPHSYM